MDSMIWMIVTPADNSPIYRTTLEHDGVEQRGFDPFPHQQIPFVGTCRGSASLSHRTPVPSSPDREEARSFLVGVLILSATT